MSQYLGQPINPDRLSHLQKLYREHRYFRLWIQKIEEQVYSSLPDVLLTYAKDPVHQSFINQMLTDLKQAQDYILAINQQPHLLAERPTVKVVKDWQNHLAKATIPLREKIYHQRQSHHPAVRTSLGALRTAGAFQKRLAYSTEAASRDGSENHLCLRVE